ncbi:uncharacterized protein VTP21DRAFT_5096 [Calcarisporiella thermophila]|uniref:uncharacterized protein n=1 Tax=Calcarisporiella thermophila TaxID=911321 RepID=UPI00374490F9
MASMSQLENHYAKDDVASIPTSPVAAAPAIANPAPLGLCGFALTTFVLSLYNASAGVSAATPPNVVVGLALFYGGIAQLLAGMWEFKAGNTFGATAFSSYGAFWLSFATMLIPGSGILGAYADVPASELKHAQAIYLLGWTIFTGIMLVASHRSSAGLVTLFFFLFITFLLLTIADFQNSAPCKVAGGGFGVVTAIIAWYNALSALLNSEKQSLFQLPVMPLKRD